MPDSETFAFPDPRDRVLYSPISTRPKVRWPDGSRVAVWFAPNVEYYEYATPTRATSLFRALNMPHPDAQQFAYRDYGNRVGFWRMTEIFDDFGLRPTVSLNVAMMDHHPEVAQAMIDRNWAFMSHGIYNTRSVIGFDVDEERDMLRSANEALIRHTGKPFKGMLGPALSMTLDTPDLMAEEGLIYHTDWVHDDQPFPITVKKGRLISVPYSYELNDGLMTGAPETFAMHCKNSFDRLWREGRDSGRVMCLALHPYAVGQPHFAQAFRGVLKYITSHDEVWLTTADEIAEYYLANCYDEQLDYARSLQVSRKSAQ